MKPDENSRNFEEIIIPIEKRYKILNKLRGLVIKMENYEISILITNNYYYNNYFNTLITIISNL